MNELIREARKLYRESKLKLYLPTKERVASKPDYVRLSSIGGCHIRSAFEKLGIEPDYPEIQEDESNQWLMDHGNYVAPMVQEALMYYAMTTDISFLPEVDVWDDEMKVIGRMDGLLKIDNQQYIIEIKDVEGIEKRSVGVPKLSHCLQTLGYMMITGISRASIITCSKWKWATYDFVKEGRGYRLYDQYGHIYTPPVWMANFNTPEILNFDTVASAIEAAHRTRDLLAEGCSPDDTGEVIDPLNEDNSFLCMWHYQKPTKKSPGAARPNCPWAYRCQGLLNKDYETERIDGRYEIVMDF